MVEFIPKTNQVAKFSVLVLTAPVHLPHTRATYQFYGYCVAGETKTSLIGTKTAFNIDLNPETALNDYVITKAS
jgi:hypothetical protein